ncbi:serum paraoxonase/arylesterase 2-like isoform X2 [Physella acuta]|uniref:serum paraoxonase/arylesterase 2-like isoform X2 n=1 Tax=Physella acuta TaxID=109671 RepID=UPI0027DD3C0F|nr:serum paraoxonase/arylesterase 2-like isoform X2 [Physella acuta]
MKTFGCCFLKAVLSLIYFLPEFGSWDIHTLLDGTTFITSGVCMSLLSQSFHAHYKNTNAVGSVYLMSLNQTIPTVTRLEIISQSEDFKVETFRPHGISVWPDYLSGQHLIYVVNHPLKEANRVEKFRFDPAQQSLYHLKTYTSSKLRLVYDVQALGEDSFYATNILYEQKVRFFMVLELFSLMPWSSVVLYREDIGFKEVLTGLTSVTGIVMSKCGNFIYVVMSLSCEIRVYSHQKDDSLILQQSYPLFTHPDNAVIDPVSGDLFIGSHPIAYQFLNHIDNPGRHKAASQVLHVRLMEGNITTVTELLYDDGDLISGSTAAVVYSKKLLVGSAFDKLVICDVSVPI